MNHFYIYHDNGQVMAQSHSVNPPAETSWERKGYERVEISLEQYRQIDRNKSVTLRQGVVDTIIASTNSEQPTIDVKKVRLAELQEKIRTDTDLPEEFREYIKLRDGL